MSRDYTHDALNALGAYWSDMGASLNHVLGWNRRPRSARQHAKNLREARACVERYGKPLGAVVLTVLARLDWREMCRVYDSLLPASPRTPHAP